MRLLRGKVKEEYHDKRRGETPIERVFRNALRNRSPRPPPSYDLAKKRIGFIELLLLGRYNNSRLHRAGWCAKDSPGSLLRRRTIRSSSTQEKRLMVLVIDGFVCAVLDNVGFRL